MWKLLEKWAQGAVDRYIVQRYLGDIHRRLDVLEERIVEVRAELFFKAKREAGHRAN